MITHDEILAAREALLERTVSFFAAQQDVTGIFLSGSLPAGSADAYSDIDLRVIATTEAQASLVSGRLDWPTQWGDLLFNEWVDGTQHCVSHFRPFVKIDVFYWTPEMFKPSPWFRMPAKIFLDRDGLVQSTLAQSQSLAFGPPPRAEVSRVLSKALAGMHEIVRRARRAELFFAHSLLDELRSNMVTLDSWIQEFEPAAPHDRKLAERVSGVLRTALQRSYVGLDTDDIDQAVVELSTVLVGQIIDLHNKFDLKRKLATDVFAADLVRNREVG
jgi:hypothetical protein